MQVIISGTNRMEFCKVVRKEDFSRRFFMTRGQLYFIPTHGMVRMRVYEFGAERDTDAVIMYRENAYVPYDTRGIIYSMDNYIADIDRYKKMSDYGWFKKNRLFFTSAGKALWKFITSGTGIVVIIVAYIFLTGGIH